MIENPLVQKIAQYVKLKLLGESTGHDWFHIERVWKVAKQLQAQEGGDLELIEISALLHDLGDDYQYNFNEKKGSLVLRGMMDVLELDTVLQEKILKITKESQYFGDDTKPPSTIEGKIVQDADWLDALGAIGVAKVFSTGGHINRVIYDPNISVRERLTKKDYLERKQAGTSYNYFYEKVLKLPNMMNTKAGKQLAKEKVEFVKLFLKQFKSEWYSKA